MLVDRLFALEMNQNSLHFDRHVLKLYIYYFELIVYCTFSSFFVLFSV